MPPQTTSKTMTIPELIALLTKAPPYTKWYLENRTVSNVNYKNVNEVISINFILCEGYIIDVIDGSYPLTTAASAVLSDDFTIIIKDGEEVFYALIAKEITSFDIGDFISGATPSDYS